jgi:hypothetical protein
MTVSDAVRREAIDTFTARAGHATDDGGESPGPSKSYATSRVRAAGALPCGPPRPGVPDGRGGVDERAVVGRVASKGLEDETKGVWYAHGAARELEPQAFIITAP